MKFLAYLLTLILATGLLSGCNKEEYSNSPANEAAGNSESKSANFRGAEPLQKDICFESQGNRVPIIMFHDLIPVRDRKSLWYDCSLEEFSQMMDAIDLDGRTVISLNDLYEHLTNGKQVPEKSIVLTFDDNYQSFYDLAWPIIQKYKHPVTMFVHTGFVGKTEGRLVGQCAARAGSIQTLAVQAPYLHHEIVFAFVLGYNDTGRGLMQYLVAQ